MKKVGVSVRLTLVVAVWLSVLTPLPPAARAVSFTPAQRSCFEHIAKAGLRLVRSKLKIVTRCKDRDLSRGTCPEPDADALRALDDRLAVTLQAGCGALIASDFATMGFPGPCPDDDASDGYTLADLKRCMTDVHETAVDAMMVPIYDAAIERLSGPDLKCQMTIAAAGSRLAIAKLKATQICRQEIIEAQLPLWPEECATSDPKTRQTIAAAEAKLYASIDGRCTDPQIAALLVCAPDQSTVIAATNCLADGVTLQIDTIGRAELPGGCGNNIVDSPDEECDGRAASACPGQCGPPSDPILRCRCVDRRRQWVIEHDAGSSLGSGYAFQDLNGTNGGYVVDLFDCDGPAGSDTECSVGPSCSLPPHQACSPAPNQPVRADTLCPGEGNGCRKTARGATGPHCQLDIQQRCSRNVDCPLPGDRCLHVLHGPPIPFSAGGVGVCVVNEFIEDVVGTTDLQTGAGAVQIREASAVYPGVTNRSPCPLCGGFCALDRLPCSSAADCTAGPCIAAPICSGGPNEGGRCQRQPPYGGPTDFFGTTSVDCPPTTSNGFGTADVAMTRSTGTQTLLPAFACTRQSFSGNACLGGTRAGVPCANPTECPGGACAPQCWCAGESEPNVCGAACVGGPNDAVRCAGDSECPAGFCHAGDCRADPEETGSVEKGRCTVPTDLPGTCSTETFRTCAEDAECQPPGCPGCAPGQFCMLHEGTRRRCFVNGVIVREGAAGIPERTTAATYCLPVFDNAALDVTVGAPGPGALTQPETTVTTGFDPSPP